MWNDVYHITLFGDVTGEWGLKIVYVNRAFMSEWLWGMLEKLLFNSRLHLGSVRIDYMPTNTVNINTCISGHEHFPR